jgi:hypothetical protein
VFLFETVPRSTGATMDVLRCDARNQCAPTLDGAAAAAVFVVVAVG